MQKWLLEERFILITMSVFDKMKPWMLQRCEVIHQYVCHHGMIGEA